MGFASVTKQTNIECNACHMSQIKLIRLITVSVSIFLLFLKKKFNEKWNSTRNYSSKPIGRCCVFFHTINRKEEQKKHNKIDGNRCSEYICFGWWTSKSAYQTKVKRKHSDWLIDTLFLSLALSSYNNQLWLCSPAFPSPCSSSKSIHKRKCQYFPHTQNDVSMRQWISMDFLFDSSKNLNAWSFLLFLSEELSVITKLNYHVMIDKQLGHCDFKCSSYSYIVFFLQL